MENERRTQAERSASTRRALVHAARELFSRQGYAAVGTPEIAAAAGVTRGALYHQFADKRELFEAVLEQVETDLTTQISQVLPPADGGSDPVGLLANAAQVWLDGSADPGIAQILLVDGPAVLGWTRWRQIGQRYGLGFTTAALQSAMDVGAIPPQPVVPLAHILVGAIDEAALYLSRAQDRPRARLEVNAVIHQVVHGLARPPARANHSGHSSTEPPEIVPESADQAGRVGFEPTT